MKSSIKALIAVIALVVIAAGVFVATKEDTAKTETSSQTQTTQNTTKPSTTDSTTNSSTEKTTTVSKADVAMHNTESDCWTIIDGGVYDITSYIPRHPGGDNILSACGVDGTDFFNGKKEGQSGDSNNHSNSRQVTSQLASLKVADLTQ